MFRNRIENMKGFFSCFSKIQINFFSDEKMLLNNLYFSNEILEMLTFFVLILRYIA